MRGISRLRRAMGGPERTERARQGEVFGRRGAEGKAGQGGGKERPGKGAGRKAGKESRKEGGKESRAGGGMTKNVNFFGFLFHKTRSMGKKRPDFHFFA